MTDNHHTPHKYGEITVPKLNEPLSELDAAIDGISPLTTKGDLWAYSTANARLAVGTNGYILEGNSSEATGVKWTPGPSHVAVLVDQKTTTTDGGTATSGQWNARDLNTELYDPRGIVAIGSNLFTPIAGTYLLEATAPAFDVGLHRLKLYNAANLADVSGGYGQVAASDAGNNVTQPAELRCTFTANGTDAYQIRHYVQTTKSNTGLGQAVGDGAVEIYLVIKLTLISV